MGIDCGFDVHPRLEPTEENKESYACFIAEVLRKYEDDDNPGAGIAVVVPHSECSYIEFQIGEHPTIPYKCEYFLRFSSKVSGRHGEAEGYLKDVYKIAKKWFGDRVQWWNEGFDQWGVWGWTEANAARRMYEQPGQH